MVLMFVSAKIDKIFFKYVYNHKKKRSAGMPQNAYGVFLKADNGFLILPRR